jgi:hypothetical protein
METEDPTEKYGLTRSTSKPVKLACWDLTLAIKTLEAHHGEEEAIFRAAIEGLVESIGAADDPLRHMFRDETKRLEQLGDKLRRDRAALLDELLVMWPAIEDVAKEESTLRPSRNILLADQPDRMTQAPIPIVTALTMMQSRHTVIQTMHWTREVSYGATAAALGPCYLLSKVIEYPKPQAMGLRDVADEARDHILHFLAERHVS